MSIQLPPGGGGRGGGLLLRSPADEFSGADRATAEAARDAAITSVPAELAEFDGNLNLGIVVTITGTNPDTTVYQVRRGGAWADVTLAVRGPGPTPAQVEAAVQAGVKGYARRGGPVVPADEIDPEITRDSEITRMLLLGLLGLSADDLADLAADEGIDLVDLDAFVADSDGNQIGDAVRYRSANGDFLVRFTTTAADQRPGFVLPAGRAIIGIYSIQGVDQTDRFAADAAMPRRYLRTTTVRRASSLLQLIRTRAA